MSSNGKFSPFESAFSRAGLLKVASPEIIAGAKHIEFSSNEIIKLLQEIIEAVPQVNLESVADLIQEVQEVSEELTVMLSSIVDSNSLAVALKHEAKLKEAEDLLTELKKLKDEIISRLTNEAGLNPVTGPGEELSVLPIGEVLPSEPLLITYERPVAKDDDEKINQDPISINLDPVVDPVGVVFNRPIGTVPAEGRLAFSDLETQQPRSPEEVETLRLLRQYQEGTVKVFLRDGKRKPLKEIIGEISRLYKLVGRERWSLKKIKPIAAEIYGLNANLVLEKRERNIRLDDAYERLFQEAQRNLQGREHRFDRSVSSVTVRPESGTDPITDGLDDDEPVSLIPAQHEASGESSQNASATNEAQSKIPAGLDLSQVPTLSVDDIVHDPLLDKGEFKGVATLGGPTSNDGVENLPDYKKDIEEVDYQFVVTQATLMVVSKVLSKIGLRSIPDLEVAEKLISEYNDTDETDIAPAIVIKSGYLTELKTLLEKLRLIKIKGTEDGVIDSGRILELDGDQVLIERLAHTGSKVTAEWVTIAELKKLNAPGSLDADTVSGLPVNDTTVPFVRDSSQISADQNNDSVSLDADKAEPKANEALPSVDQAVDTTPEVSVIEESLSTEESYVREKERYSSLRDSIYENRLGLKFYYELDRAEIHIQTIDYVLSKYKDDDPIKEQKIKDNVSALSKINTRLAEGLLEVAKKSADSSFELATSDIIDSEILRGATVDFSGGEDLEEVPDPVIKPAPPVVTEEPSYLDLVADDPLMKSTLEAERKAKWRESVGLSSNRQIDILPSKEREQMRSEYAKERTLAIETRTKFKEAETNYQTKLKEFYENRSIFSKAGGAIRTLFGGRPKLPPELEKLQTIYKYTKEQYALQLRDAWVKRAGAFVDNKVLDEAKPTIKKSFAKKFILEPRYRLLDLQAEAFERNAENSKLKPIMGFVRKHRTALRWIGLGMAAGTGAAAGGALVAGFNMARWGVSTFGGLAVANEVYRRKEKDITEAVSNLSLEKEKIEKEFTLAKLNDFDESLAFGSLEVERATLKQKVYAAGAAVAFGGAVNAGTSLVDATFNHGATGPHGGTVNNGSEATTSTDEAIRLAHERRTLEIEQRVNDINRAVAEDNARVAAERMGVSYRPPASPVANEAIQSFAVTPETLLQMGGVKVPHYSPSGELISQTTVSNIRLEGTNLSGLVENALPDGVVTEVYSYINMRVNDILAAHPNFSQIQLEKELFKDLENVYGGKEWWTSAKINEVKIGSMVTALPGARASIPGMGAIVADVNPVDSMLPGEAMAVASKVVTDNLPVKGDTPTLVDQPYPFSGKEPILYTRSGGLSIEQTDAGVASVPIIKAIYNPVEGAGAGALGEVIEQREINHVPLMQSEPTPLPPDPEKYVAAGNYTQSPAFRDYVSSEYGGMERFNKIVLREALEVEGETYDIFNKWLNEYQSPYEMSLAKMTIGDLREAFGGPELGSKGTQVDVTGLPRQYNTDAIRQYASANNFNYETVRKWLIALEDLKKEFPHQNATTLEDLFARSIIKADLLALKAKGISA